ncbi:MAG TPA: F0F1 ATP synthase subunit epsilon [Candidatus Acidoferrales bacterium]|nr:F0F1 ATP synthase subunit epsilon [Candidatus Acidoferrales bacterium]
MADKLTLRVVTPTRLVLDEEVDEVTAAGALGEFTVLPNHIAFLTLLEIGVLSYKQGGVRYALATSGGYAEVLDNVVTVLANTAEFADEIDVARAQRAKEAAEQRMAGRGMDESDFIEAQAELRRAQVRLAVAGKEARR